AATVRCTFIALPCPWSPSASTSRSGAAPRTMLNESIISPNETRSRSGPPSRLAATQEPDRNAVLKPASWVSLAVRPSHTAGITTRPGWARTFRSCSGALVISLPPLDRLVRAGAPALHHLVAGPAVVDDLARRLDTGGRQTLRIEQADLHQHRCLIPVDVLMRDLVSDESHDGDQRNLDLPAGRRNARQQPVDLGGVREAEDHLVDDLVGADRAADRRHPHVRRIAADEMVLVEALELIVADAARHGRHVVDVGGLELVAAMRFPERDQIRTGHAVSFQEAIRIAIRRPDC